MGWTFSPEHRTAQSLADSLSRDYARAPDYQVLAKAVTSESGHRVLWTLVERTTPNTRPHGVAKGQRLILCDLIEGSPNGFGHKSMDEGSGPYYYSVPLHMLDAAEQTVPVNAYAADWRKSVRARHEAERQAERDARTRARRDEGHALYTVRA